jgi:hypothetical protein
MTSDSKEDHAGGHFLIDRRKFLGTAAARLALSGVSAAAPWQASARDNARANEQSPDRDQLWRLDKSGIVQWFDMPNILGITLAV